MIADVTATYLALAPKVMRHALGLAHVEVVHHEPEGELVQALREETNAPLIPNTGFGRLVDRESAPQLVDRAGAHAVSVGRLASANPDLVARWREDAPVNTPNEKTFYGGGVQGDTDYPVLR